MKKTQEMPRITRGIALLLLLCLLLVIPSAAEESEPTEKEALPTVRLGLYWGDTALECANLLNDVGSGYDFGYYDQDRIFVPLAHTEETAISMLKDWSMYYVGGQYVSEAEEGAPVVGCYHIRLGEFADYESACLAAAEYEDGYPAYINGTWYAYVGSYTSLERAEAALAERALLGIPMTGSSRCITVVATESQRVLFQYDGGAESSLGVMPCMAEDREKPITWFRNREYYGGFQYTRQGGGNLTVVNFLEMDDYICGVIPYEMSPSWPLEALKAQAVAARTYAMKNLGSHESDGFDLCGTVCCQTYLGVWKDAEICDQAVRETHDVCMTYEGEYINAVYFSSDGGATEDAENVFQQALPYLRGKLDPYESYVDTGYESWEMIYSAAEITDILQTKGYNCSDIVSVTPTYTKLGNIYSLKFTDSRGVNWTFSRERAGSILYSTKYNKSTKSQRFTVSDASQEAAKTIYVNSMENAVSGTDSLYVLSGTGAVQKLESDGAVSVLSASGSETVRLDGSGATITADSYRFAGSGYGHNLGMSQFGAKAMADLGMNYLEILHFYYTGVEID